jgi:hypothetical protein
MRAFVVSVNGEQLRTAGIRVEHSGVNRELIES